LLQLTLARARGTCGGRVLVLPIPTQDAPAGAP
jgi:hypothetical protein